MASPLEEAVRLLSRVYVLEPLSRDELEELARRAPGTRVGRGEVFLAAQEEPGEKLFILKEGRVRVYTVDTEGRELTLSVVGGGDIIREVALTDRRLPEVYMRAMEPSVVCSLRRKDLERIILRRPEVGVRLVGLLSERLRLAEIRLAELAYKDVRARLASLILRLIESEGVVTGEGYKVPTRYTHQQLATMIGAGRVAVSRAFARLREEGVVKLRERRIVVADLKALRRIAGNG
ncbi:transcriptional regulator, Crp/Fnr family [Rubrobacter xylanophilus DSM 9941]|uniref:Transcriptional regulator, Crp/Fnr family n=1 Tax=Rubrobacter xylanophilus (strain DSM 9941 / JCM 11954 / NBRC 16129 / PRD-1) TaxID=266117 RepID=Q1AUA7_RUBXD|nr:Crp/Fnr family transcriptional regulator [Rubrobacter xylanophilus]ABG05021.1 transcriptional regulator, Crp/Fnr family [Rubrobacter xylanophilus DSM 9941]